MRLLILVLFGFASTVSLQAAELVEGVIYLKNGTRIEYTDLDRIALPKQNGTVRAYLHAFSKQNRNSRTSLPKSTLSFAGTHRPGNIREGFIMPRP